MADYLAYIAVKFLNKLFSLMPIRLALWIGRRLGTLAFLFNRKRRVIAYANLKAAFAGEKAPKELKGLTKKVYQNLLQTFVEVLNLTKVNKKYVDKYVKIINMERIDRASKSGRGTILLTAHFGGWELSSLVSAVVGYPILVLAREQKLGRINELLNQLRESKGCKVIRKGISTKNIIRALRDKQIIGVLSDQDAGKNGTFVTFFGRPTSSHSGPMEMAKRTGSIILPNFIVRVKGPYHKVFLEEYIDFRLSKGGDDIKENLQKFTTLLESYIRKYPDQWLWLHKRWKSTPLRTVLVLNDGRRGHLNQSLAVAGQIRRARILQGYKMDDTKIKIVDVKFKNGFKRTMLLLCAASASWRCHGCMKCMRYCLEKDSYEGLMNSYAEFIVSCGSRLGPVNVFMSKENNAKNIVIMRPDILSFGKFNLVVIPKHDHPGSGRNVIETLLAPNLISEDLLKERGVELLKEVPIESGKKFIGVFIGGDNPEYTLTPEVINGVIDGIIKFCADSGANLLVTTSRRTPGEIESILKKRLESNPICKLLIIANEKNVESAVGGILYHSKVAVVSGESVSMISEAISSGKKTIAFELEKKNKLATKHGEALRNLESDGYLSIAKVGEVYDAVKRAWSGEGSAKKVDDMEHIFEAVRKII